MNIEVFGAGDRTRVASRILKESELPTGSCVEKIKLFAVPTSRDGIYVTGTDVTLDSVAEGARRGDFFVGYGFPEKFRTRLSSLGIAYYDAALDEDFLSENAYITAIGLISYLFGSSLKIPRDEKIGIVGYGRIGKALLRMLLYFEAELTVYTGKRETALELGRLGVSCREFEPPALPLGEISRLDVLINTAPCDFSECFKGGLPEGLRVLELASGDNFRGVTGVEKLPSLPDRMYPVSAGSSYARHAARHLTQK